MKVIKRNGTEVEYTIDKIIKAVNNANKDVKETDRMSFNKINELAKNVENKMIERQVNLNVEDIQDLVEDEIINFGYINLAKEYIKFRYKRAIIRKSNSTDEQIMSIIDCNNEEIKQENSNKNPTIVSVQRDYMAGEVSKDISRRFLIPSDVLKAHEEGLIHFHDQDYFAQKMHNCCLINLKDMLENGTVISEVMIEPPKSFVTACTITTQIIAQVASSQYGGQTISLAHLAPFVQKDREKITKSMNEEFDALIAIKGKENYTEEELNYIEEIKKTRIEQKVRREIEKGVQTMNYQVVTLQTTNGQAPFITFFMYLNEVNDPQVKKDLAYIIEEVIKQRIQGLKNEQGVWVTPAFPKLIYVLQENNIYENSEYYYLTKLSAKCSAKRLVPDYISEKKIKELREGNCYPCMGCRSFLAPWKDETGKYKFYGRFNQGVVTINLVDVGLSANKDIDEFWKIFDERLELCHRGLLCRHKRLKGTVSDVAPILWQYGALARLKKGETIDKLLYGGYSSISLGYAGLSECVYSLIGESHTTENGEKLALQIMQYMNDKINKWKEEDNLGYAMYGTPIESTTYKFAKAIKKRFGIIEHVSDKNYITNSYHIHVTEKIDAFSKLSFESKFQELSLGGAISYVELPNMVNNTKALLSIMHHMYNTILYAEVNVKSDYCMCCGFDGEIQIIEENKKLIWKCPKCGNTNQNMMHVARRTCGYIGSQFWNQGRTAEIRDRVLHVD